jgi:hypothetical protein
MLGAMAIAAAQVPARKQMLVYPHGAFVFTAAAKQVAQGEVQFRRVRVVLHRLDECIDGLVLLFIEQKVEPPEIGLWCTAVFEA